MPMLADMDDYCGAGARLAPSAGLSLSPSRWAWQVKHDGAFCRLRTDAAGRIASLLMRSGRPFQTVDAADFIGLAIGLPNSDRLRASSRPNRSFCGVLEVLVAGPHCTCSTLAPSARATSRSSHTRTATPRFTSGRPRSNPTSPDSPAASGGLIATASCTTASPAATAARCRATFAACPSRSSCAPRQTARRLLAVARGSRRRGGGSSRSASMHRSAPRIEAQDQGDRDARLYRSLNLADRIDAALARSHLRRIIRRQEAPPRQRGRGGLRWVLRVVYHPTLCSHQARARRPLLERLCMSDYVKMRLLRQHRRPPLLCDRTGRVVLL